jgi:hypothetical protein
MSICLIIIYNHRFERNINKLNSYYKSRFDNIYHVIPFYQSEDENVITVYENSHQFNGYIAQAFKSYYKEKFDYYVFAGDDLLLNPTINQDNIVDKLGIDKNSSYIKKLHSIGSVSIPWYHIPKILYKFVSSQGVSVKGEIPDKTEADKIAIRHGLNIKKISFIKYLKHIFLNKSPMSFFRTLAYFIGYGYLKRFKNLREPPYPLVVGYSDFFVIPKHNIKEFIHYCGVFAGMNLFVEVAIPTALMLSSETIKSENKGLRGVEFWDESKIQELMKDNNLSVIELFKNHPDQLYFHPIKLSKWKLE